MGGLSDVFAQLEETHLQALRTGSKIAQGVDGIPVLGDLARYFERMANAGTAFRGYYLDNEGNKVDVPEKYRLGVATGLYLDAFKHFALYQVEGIGLFMGAGGPIAAAGGLPEAQAVTAAVRGLTGEGKVSDTVDFVAKATGSPEVAEAVKVARSVVDAANNIPLVKGWVDRILGRDK